MYSLGEYLAGSRDLLIALADPVRQDLVQLLAHAEFNVASCLAALGESTRRLFRGR